EEWMIIRDAGKLLDQALHEIDPDRRHLARRRSGEERAPAPGCAAEDGDAQMREVRPERDLPRPHGRGDELGRDDERVAAVSVADKLGECRERGGTLTGAERRDQERGIVLVEEGRGSLLIGAQNASGEGRVHLKPSACGYLLRQLFGGCGV